MMAVGNTRSSSDRDISKHVYTAICSLVNCFEQTCLLLPRVQATGLQVELHYILFFFLVHRVLISVVYNTLALRVSFQVSFLTRASLTSGLELDRTTERKEYEILCPFVQTLASVNQRDLLQNTNLVLGRTTLISINSSVRQTRPEAYQNTPHLMLSRML